MQEIEAILQKVDILSALDGVPHGVALLDSTFRLLGLNRFLAALTGYTTEEARGIYADFILRSSLPRNGNPLKTVFNTGESLSIDGDIIDRGRKKVPVRFTISPLESRQGAAMGLVVTLEDISLLQDLDKKAHGITGLEGVIGHSAKMEEVFDLLPVIAQTDASALITGETGTGKDLIAAAIHHASKRSRYPFIKVNCGALPESLLESELFGHQRGAFTGADRDKPGMFRLAHGGTIFLTEVGDLPLALQVKLLTVLDDREFFPLGGSKKVRVDVRVIAATHRNLAELVKAGKFREDLYYRLNVLRLHLPPLRERSGDLPVLLDHFLQKFVSHDKKGIKGFSPQAISVLSNYSYPGNIRELRNIVEYAVTICQGPTIQVEHLPKFVLAAEATPAAEQDYEKVSETAERSGARSPTPSPDATKWSEVERQMIIDALRQTGGRRTQAAKILGWGRSTLWRKLKEHGLA